MKKTAFILMIVTVLSKVIGFVREMVLANFYGTDMVADAFVIAFAIPVVLFNFVSTGVNTGMIPMLTEIEKNKGKEAGFQFTSNIFNIVTIFSTALFVVGFIFAEPLVKVFAFGFTGEKLRVAALLTRGILIGVYGLAISSVYRGFLHYNGYFTVTAMTGFVMNAFTIAAIVLSALTKNLVILAVGAGLGQLMQYAIFIRPIIKTGYKHSWAIDLKDPHVKQLALLALPIIAGVAVNDINTLIDRNLASVFATNGVAVINYANRLIGFVSGIVIVSIVTAIYPTLARMASDKNIKGMKKEFASSISILNLLVIPALVGLALFAKPIVSLLFERGQFNQNDVTMVGTALILYTPMLIGVAYRDVLSRMFYSLHDMKTPAVNAAISMILNVSFSLLFAKFIGLYGLAVGTSIATLLSTLLLMSVLRYRLKGLSLGRIIPSTIKVVISTILMAAASGGFYYYTSIMDGSRLKLILAILIAVAVYGVSVFVSGVDEATELKGILLKRVKR